MRIRPLPEQHRHGRDEIVEPLIIVERADESDHIGIPEAQPARQVEIGGERVAEQVHVDAVGGDDDLLGGDGAGDEIVAQALADDGDAVGAAGCPGFEHSGGAIAERAFAAGAVADRRILPEGADLVEQGNRAALGDAEGGEGVENGRMDVELVRLPLFDQAVEPRGERADLAPFAQRRGRSGYHRRSEEGDAVDQFRVAAACTLANPGQAGDLQAPRLLGGDDRPRAERIAAVKRQAVVEHVQDAHAPRFATTNLTLRQPRLV